MIDILNIFKTIPHRYPMLMIDRVHEITDKKIVAQKNVTINEPFFTGHFPQEPIMPGVLIVEALAQTSAMLTYTERVDAANQIFLLVGVDKIRFRRAVVPGDCLILTSELTRVIRGLYFFDVVAKVDEEVAVDGVIMATFKK